MLAPEKVTSFELKIETEFEKENRNLSSCNKYLHFYPPMQAQLPFGPKLVQTFFVC
jgi:hypothetical protein